MKKGAGWLLPAVPRYPVPRRAEVSTLGATHFVKCHSQKYSAMPNTNNASVRNEYLGRHQHLRS